MCRCMRMRAHHDLIMISITIGARDTAAGIDIMIMKAIDRTYNVKILKPCAGSNVQPRYMRIRDRTRVRVQVQL